MRLAENLLYRLKVVARSQKVKREMAKPTELVGDCNKCGLCCVVDAPEGGYLKCLNLIVRDWDKIGQPEATKCSLHSSRTDGMKIYLVDRHGKLRGESKCHTGRNEMESIIERRLLEKGCSLEIKEVKDGSV